MIQLRIVVNFVLRFEVDISIMLGMKYKGKKLCLSGPLRQFLTVQYLCAKPTALHACEYFEHARWMRSGLRKGQTSLLKSERFLNLE